MPLKPSGQTPTSSPVASSRSASGLQASVLPVLRASGPSTGVVNTRSAPSIRRNRWLGVSSCTAVAVITPSSAHSAPAWLADDQRAGIGRQVVHADAPRCGTSAVQLPRGRQHGGLREVGVEAELVHLVVAGDAAAQEGQPGGGPALPVAAGTLRRGCSSAAGGRQVRMQRRHRSVDLQGASVVACGSRMTLGLSHDRLPVRAGSGRLRPRYRSTRASRGLGGPTPARG